MFFCPTLRRLFCRLLNSNQQRLNGQGNDSREKNKYKVKADIVILVIDVIVLSVTANKKIKCENE